MNSVLLGGKNQNIRVHKQRKKKGEKVKPKQSSKNINGIWWHATATETIIWDGKMEPQDILRGYNIQQEAQVWINGC